MAGGGIEENGKLRASRLSEMAFPGDEGQVAKLIGNHQYKEVTVKVTVVLLFQRTLNQLISKSVVIICCYPDFNTDLHTCRIHQVTKEEGNQNHML